MGLFDWIGAKISSAPAPIRKVIDTSLDVSGKIAGTISTITSHPIGAITNFKKAYEKTAQETGLQKVVGATSNALLITAPLSSGVRGAVVKGITSLSTGSKIALGGSALLGAGILSTSETARDLTIKTISDTPENLVALGEKAGEVIEGNLPIEDYTTKDWYKTMMTLGLGAGLSILLAGGIYLGYKIVNGKLKKVEENLPPEDNENKKEVIMNTGSESVPATPINQDTGVPTIAPQRELVSISSKKRRRKVKKKETPQIRINNAIAINNSPVGLKITNKRYLKEVLHY